MKSEECNRTKSVRRYFETSQFLGQTGIPGWHGEACGERMRIIYVWIVEKEEENPCLEL